MEFNKILVFPHENEVMTCYDKLNDSYDWQIETNVIQVYLIIFRCLFNLARSECSLICLCLQFWRNGWKVLRNIFSQLWKTVILCTANELHN